jgi:carboxypeptidase family protein/TonB-dependent receptor-like protein
MTTLTASLLVIVCASAPAWADLQQPTSTGAIEGTVSAQQGGSPLPRAEVAVSDDAGRVTVRRISDGDGRFVVVGLPAGSYRVTVTLHGFATTDVAVDVIIGRTTRVAVDLAIAETIAVVASSEILTAAGTLAPEEAMASRELDQFVPGTGFQSAVRMFSSVVTSGNGVNIKGGRPNQTGVQLGAGTLVDPASAIAHVALPDDAIDSVTVLPNPYGVEYGRFASGIVVIQTQRAADQWRTQVNRVVPTIRNARGELFRFRLDTFGPRFATGGPLIKDRLFLAQTGQLRYSASDVPSRPESELHTSTFFSSFSRADANLSRRHSLVATVGLFPNRSTSTNLGTFTPPNATVDVHAFATHAAVTARTLWSDDRASETMIQMLQSRTDVLPQGTSPMVLQPETTLGNFFNQQSRNSTSVQLVELLTVPRNGPWGSHHLFKIGVDLLAAAYDGTSDSRPVLIARGDGTLARRLDYAGATRQSVGNVDAAVFAQDRYELTPRWNVEFGARIDRDGIVERVNVAPRIGTAVLLNRGGSAVFRGGVGLFHGRTPSVVGAFGSFTSAVDARFAADGVTPIGPAVRVTPVAAPGLETPRSRAWDAGVEYRLSEEWMFHANVVQRDGRSEFLVQPTFTPAAELRLSSDGASRYRDLEAGVHFTRGTIVDVEALYDWSDARGDLNTVTSFFDTVMAPVVGANAYAALNADVPHRLFVRGRVLVTPRWLLLGAADWRTGVPYSSVNEMLDFVEPRNERRFPDYARLELGFQYRADVFRWKPWVGVRVTNVFSAFLPSDVQANTGSPFFGQFYNSEDRHVRLQVRFER